MESKEAAEVLTQMLQSRSLSDEERGAILKAIGILGWTMLAESRLKNKKNKGSGK